MTSETGRGGNAPSRVKSQTSPRTGSAWQSRAPVLRYQCKQTATSGAALMGRTNASMLRREIIGSGAHTMTTIKERYPFCRSWIGGVNVAGTDPNALLSDSVSKADPEVCIRCIIEDGLGLIYGRRALSIARY